MFLAACGGNGFNNTQVVVQKEYVIRTAPDVMKTLPPLPVAIANPKSATNNQIAVWINNTEDYTANLEAMIQTLVNFYEKPVNTNEAKGMQVVTPLSSPTPASGRLIQPQVEQPVTAASSARGISPLQRLRELIK